MTEKIPVSAVYGPVIQGEGPLCGLPTMFVRLSGCDYRCDWCDTLHCVEPEKIADDDPDNLSPDKIVERVIEEKNVYPDHDDGSDITGQGLMVTLSGGNPAIHNLKDVAKKLRSAGFRVAVETQGSISPEWLEDVHRVVLSPKPPSAGTHPNGDSSTPQRDISVTIDKSKGTGSTYLKIVVFDEDDYNYAMRVYRQFNHRVDGFYLQAGTNPDGTWRDNYKMIEDAIFSEPNFPRDVRVLPQLHVVVHGQGDEI